jgi:outer membrane protein assembly factor BamE (lipoprotein component of BamABCDE complex)
VVYRFRRAAQAATSVDRRELSLRVPKFKTLAAFGPARLTGGFIAVALIAGCNAGKTMEELTPGETLSQGYVIDPQQLELVPVGSSREQVILALGSPSTTATFDNEVFYYISQTRHRSVAFMNPTLVDQKVLAVYFDKDGRVARLANYGLKDGKLFDFISRTTPTGGIDRGFIAGILSGKHGGSKMNPIGNVMGGGMGNGNPY